MESRRISVHFFRRISFMEIHIYIYILWRIESIIKGESFSGRISREGFSSKSMAVEPVLGNFSTRRKVQIAGEVFATRKRGKCLATTIETWPASRRYQIARLSPLINCNFGSFPNDQSRNFPSETDWAFKLACHVVAKFTTRPFLQDSRVEPNVRSYRVRNLKSNENTHRSKKHDQDF